ncbi:MAG: chitobiase/beta-hexosaminidase C-terminal domain-containing protein [Puniceicoccaceae bacterium]
MSSLRPSLPLCLVLATICLFSQGHAQSVRINELSAFPTLVLDATPGPEDWRHPDFDDSSWGLTTLPIGMDAGTDYQVTTNLHGEMYLKATTLYTRSLIEMEPVAAQSAEDVNLIIDYDDAFVLYIDGIAVAHGNVTFDGSPLPYTALADGSHRASNDAGDGQDHREVFNLGPAYGVFQPGTNVIAIQLLNQSIRSSDAFLHVDVQVGTTSVNGPADPWRYFVGLQEPSPITEPTGIEGDWLELHNYGTTAIDLAGWSLTDDATLPRKWIFPSVSIPANGYLLVFATDIEQRDPALPLQVPFKLSSSGEYLGLYNAAGTVVSELAPEFPPQVIGTSYGWDSASGSYQLFTAMTPGTANLVPAFEGVVADTVFSIDRGFYDLPFDLVITSATEGATIRYTTDGSLPTESNGTTYTGPVPIATTTVLRAYAFKEGFKATDVDTQTYIFLEDVIRQDNNPEGYPQTWKNIRNREDMPADYEMDPEVTDSDQYRDQMRQSLLSLPTLSIVTAKENLFDRNTGIFMNPQETGMDWERPVSLELIYPDGREGFQIDAGLRMQGGHMRDPQRSPKRSFRLAFRRDYEDGNLKFPLFPQPDADTEFDTLILRGHGNQSWLHHNTFRGDNRGRAQYVRDQFAKDLQGAMGSPYLHNINAFLYINGIFWGLFNPTERASNQFGASYFGGDEDDYDCLNSSEVIDGTIDAWNTFLSLVRQDTSQPGVYNQIAEVLDLEAFTDYMMLNHWGGNEDWDHHNWYSIRNRNGGKWYFLAWDSEFIFETPQSNTTLKNTEDNPGGIFHSLLRNAEYRILVTDRIQKHLRNNGVLTTDEALRLWEERSVENYRALVAESARWGDYRRDVHRTAGPYELYTRDNQWVKERQRLRNNLIPVRNSLLLQQYAELGLIPPVPAPTFSRYSGSLSPQNPLVMETFSTGNPIIYYTLNGPDPRQPGGSVSPQALVYSEPLSVNLRTSIKARILSNGVWGPLQEGNFHPEGDPADLQIAEIHYAPLPTELALGRDLEFIEIRNAGPAPISLYGVQLSGAVSFSFLPGQQIQPDERILVVSNAAAFAQLHPSAPVAGEYAGNLSNDGEHLVLEHATLGRIQEVVYQPGNPWPEEAATAGYSLIPANIGRRGWPTQSTAWKASPNPGGTPGEAEESLGVWVDDYTLGWVWSPYGEPILGNWVWWQYLYAYVASEAPSGRWVWLLK